MRARTPTARQGMRGVGTRWVAMIHGKPPFGERPGGSLARGRDLPDEVVSVVGRPGQVQVVEQGRQVLLEASRRGHATALPRRWPGRASGVGGHGRAHRGERVVQP